MCCVLGHTTLLFYSDSGSFHPGRCKWVKGKNYYKLNFGVGGFLEGGRRGGGEGGEGMNECHGA